MVTQHFAERGYFLFIWHRRFSLFFVLKLLFHTTHFLVGIFSLFLGIKAVSQHVLHLQKVTEIYL